MIGVPWPPVGNAERLSSPVSVSTWMMNVPAPVYGWNCVVLSASVALSILDERATTSDWPAAMVNGPVSNDALNNALVHENPESAGSVGPNPAIDARLKSVNVVALAVSVPEVLFVKLIVPEI